MAIEIAPFSLASLYGEVAVRPAVFRGQGRKGRYRWFIITAYEWTRYCD